jgi:hypothetical protein
MPFIAIRGSALTCALVLAFGGAASAQSAPLVGATILTVGLDGTLGPVISGSDPAGLDGQSATVTVTAKESLSPYKTTSNSASYRLPVGAIVVDVNGTDYTSTSKTSMTIKLTRKADILTLKSSVNIYGRKVAIVDTSSLAPGSWTSGVFEHPAAFSPSPQDLASPSSKFQYTVFGETTVLGVTGSIANSDAP